MFRPLPLRLSLIAVALLSVVLGALLIDRHDGRLHILFPAIKGDGALIITPDGKTVLIDGGADGAAVAT